MDRLLAIGSPASLWPARVPAGRGAAAPDKADGQQRLQHFITHVDAECFVSLLQTMDPPPADSRARHEYQRYYRQLRDVLTVPLPPPDPQPLAPSTDPLR
jgi:hypothetical protein